MGSAKDLLESRRCFCVLCCVEGTKIPEQGQIKRMLNKSIFRAQIPFCDTMLTVILLRQIYFLRVTAPQSDCSGAAHTPAGNAVGEIRTPFPNRRISKISRFIFQSRFRIFSRHAFIIKVWLHIHDRTEVIMQASMLCILRSIST